MGGVKLILFYMGEYAHMITAAALMVILYFGGYSLYPLTEDSLLPFLGSEFIVSLTLLLVFIVKLFLLLFVFIWIRWSLPRFRYDQLMDLGWKILLPWALFNFVLTALFIFLAVPSPIN